MAKHSTVLFFIMVLFFDIHSYSQVRQNISSDYTPLHWAAAQGYAEMVRVLVDKGYNVNAQDSNGFTPLHYAAASGSYPAVELLVNEGADMYLVNKRNVTAMAIAAQAGEQKIVDFLFIKMRSTRVDQLRAQAEEQRVNSDLIQAAKARSEAERLRQQASEWTKEAQYWRAEAEKWTREANLLKEKQIQIDQLAKERFDQIIQEKKTVDENYKSEQLARTAAERVLREQNANTVAQIRAYEAQNAALAAQRATDAAIDNLAEEFLKQGMTYNPNMVKSARNLQFEDYEEQENLPFDPTSDNLTLPLEVLNTLSKQEYTISDEEIRKADEVEQSIAQGEDDIGDLGDTYYYDN